MFAGHAMGIGESGFESDSIEPQNKRKERFIINGAMESRKGGGIVGELDENIASKSRQGLKGKRRKAKQGEFGAGDPDSPVPPEKQLRKQGARRGNRGSKESLAADPDELETVIMEHSDAHKEFSDILDSAKPGAGKWKGRQRGEKKGDKKSDRNSADNMMSSSADISEESEISAKNELLGRRLAEAEAPIQMYPSGILPDFKPTEFSPQHRPGQNAIFGAFFSRTPMGKDIRGYPGTVRKNFDGDIVIAIHPGMRDNLMEMLNNQKVIVYEVDITCVDAANNPVNKDTENCRFTSVPEMEAMPMAQLRYYLYWYWSKKYDATSKLMI